MNVTSTKEERTLRLHELPVCPDPVTLVIFIGNLSPW